MSGPNLFRLTMLSRACAIRRSAAACLLLSALLLGCSGSPPSGTVAGKVTSDGKPVAKWMVNFQSVETKVGDSALLEPDGSFSIKNPLTSGTYVVFLTAPLPEMPKPNSPPPPVADLTDVPEKYLSAETSKLTVEIKGGPNTLDIVLKK